MLKKIFYILIYIFATIGFILTAGYFAIKLGLTKTGGIIDNQRSDFLHNTHLPSGKDKTYYWQTLPEWQTLKTALQKETEIINRSAIASGVPARLIVSNLVAEQLRFFYDDRESYKKFFEPLKILGSQTQFSWGVMGIKEDTAVHIENNLKNPTSPYYLGLQYEHILDFKTASTSGNSANNSTDVSMERFTRMTDQHKHYYNYLYAGLYLAEIEHQWKQAGFNISDRPEILSTLYNIGFSGSKPNANPQSGGAPIPIGNQTYSFGTIAAQFYNSNELLSEFPK